MIPLQLLKDASVVPNHEMISAGLKDSFSAYEFFMTKTTDMGIGVEWRYYNDGNAWLCKNTFKKKTIFWLSIWEGFFKISLFFTEKNRDGVSTLPITRETKELFANQPKMGRLIPLVLAITSIDQTEDALTLVTYKKDCH